MSRFSGDEGEGDLPAIFWEIDLQRALTSGRGQRILRDFEAALRSMPVRRLEADDQIVHWDEDVQEGAACAVGAYAAYQRVKAGETWPEAFEALAERWGGESDYWEPERLGRSVGLARTVAGHLAWLNDEQFGDLKPRQRWRAMLGWVRETIKPEPASVAA